MRVIVTILLIFFLFIFSCGKEGSESAPVEAEQASADRPIPEDTEIITTESGLRYSILEKGAAGPHPGLSDTLTVHYTGWVEDSSVFDSSFQRGRPSNVTPLKVLPGWREGLQLMTPGSKFKLTIPYDLAFGEKGRPPRIPPKATLIYEIELIEIKKGPALPEFRTVNPAARKTTASGLVYEVLTPGTEISPDSGDTVHLKFTLWNADGALVNTNELPGSRPSQLRVDEADLPFLNEALQLLKEGARYRFEVPPELTYGDKGAPPYVPPNSKTVWEIELEKVIKPLPNPDFSLSPEDKMVVTESGLKYEIIREGTGRRPTKVDRVSVHYAGWLEDGTLFDSSYQRGEKASFYLNRVIPGWTEGLQLMKEGAVYKFTIPPELGYGERGSGQNIPPNAVLIFVVELFEVEN